MVSAESWDNRIDNMLVCICVHACVYYHHDFSNLLPLLLCGVYASWIMGTGMQNKDGMLWATLWETERNTITVNAFMKITDD